MNRSRFSKAGKPVALLLLLPTLVRTAFYLNSRLLEFLFTFTNNGKARFFPPQIYPWTAMLEENWPKIRAELDLMLGSIDQVPNYQDVAPSQKALSTDDKWKAVVFRVMKHRVEANAQKCPDTAALIDSIPGVVYAMFSVMKPGKEIAPHRGAYAGALNCHLAVLVPEQSDRCGIRVDGEERHWEEGRMLIFNDRYTHEAWNRSDETRVVLLMYVVRPLPFPLSALNRGTIWVSQFLRGPELTRIRKLADDAGRTAAATTG